MAKPFHTQHIRIVPIAHRAPHLGRVRLAPTRGASSEHTNKPAQPQLKPHFTDVGTGSTGQAKRHQFVRLSFIDARDSEHFSKSETPSQIRFTDIGTGSTGQAKRHQFVKLNFTDARDGEHFSKSETPSQIRTDKASWPPLRRAQGLRPSYYDGTISLEKNIPPSSSVEPDGVVIDTGKTIIVPLTEEFLNPQAARKAASPPYAQSRTTLTAITQQYVILLRILLAEYRTTWVFYVIGGLMVPLSFAFFIAALGGAGDPGKAVYLLGGNMALSITTGPTSFLVAKIGSARQSKEFHYWTALPVAKLLLVLAIVSVALVFALPGLLGIYVFGSLLLGLPFEASFWLLLPLTPLGVLCLAGLGALLGFFARSGQEANVFSSLLAVFVGILSPILVPLESLPPPLRIISQFIPTTYVADAFRAVLGEYQGTNLAFDIIILALFATVLLTIMYFRLDWRNS